MSSKLFSQIIIGLGTSIGGNILYNHGVQAYEYLTRDDVQLSTPPRGTPDIDPYLKEKLVRIKELTDQSRENDPSKSFELAVIGLSDFFGDDEVEQASITLMLAIIKNENCGDKWEKYGNKSRTFLTTYLGEPYQMPADLPSICDPASPLSPELHSNSG